MKTILHAALLATLAAALTHSAPTADAREDELQAVRNALDKFDSVERSSDWVRPGEFLWEIRFFRGDHDGLTEFLSQLANSAAKVELIIHEGTGRKHLDDSLQSITRLRQQGTLDPSKLGAVLSTDHAQFTMGTFWDPPILAKGRPFPFDWVVDIRQALGPGIVPPEDRLRTTIHLFADGQVDLGKVDVPGSVKVTAGGRIGRFIRRVEVERKFGKEYIRRLQGDGQATNKP